MDTLSAQAIVVTNEIVSHIYLLLNVGGAASIAGYYSENNFKSRTRNGDRRLAQAIAQFAGSHMPVLAELFGDDIARETLENIISNKKNFLEMKKIMESQHPELTEEIMLKHRVCSPTIG